MTSVAAYFIAFTILAQDTSQLGRSPEYSRVQQLKQEKSIRRDSNTATWIDTSSRSTVTGSYLLTFLPTTLVSPGWTGNINTGDFGSTSLAYQNAVLGRINWVRALAGIASFVAFSSTYSTKDQQAALMMSSNGQLNSAPPATWTYYTAAGADGASHSNLCLESPYLADPGCVSQYMQDFGISNGGVGHRRWLLYPQTQTMGTGDVQPQYPMPFANALWVIDSHFSDPRPVTRDGFIAWPPKGYVPYEIVPARWSFSYPGADFTNATVLMQRSGGPVAVRLEPPQQTAGENTIVWVPDNLGVATSIGWPRPTMDTPIGVTVANVIVSGVKTTFNYTVTVIDPNSSLSIAGHITEGGVPRTGILVTLSDGSSASTDSSGSYFLARLRREHTLSHPVP